MPPEPSAEEVVIVAESGAATSRMPRASAAVPKTRLPSTSSVVFGAATPWTVMAPPWAFKLTWPKNCLMSKPTLPCKRKLPPLSVSWPGCAELGMPSRWGCEETKVRPVADVVGAALTSKTVELVMRVT